MKKAQFELRSQGDARGSDTFEARPAVRVDTTGAGEARRGLIFIANVWKEN